jgi:hypothetical protein
MRKLLTSALFYFFMATVGIGQTDQRLMERLDSVLMATQKSDFNAVLDFTYPKLFTIVPRSEMLKALKDAFETEEFSTTVDSLKLTKVYPVFVIAGASFTKVQHSMLMLMKFKEPLDSAASELMLQAMGTQFGEKNVRFDKGANTIRVFMLSDLVAVKDAHSPEWSFVNFDPDEDSPIASLLFSAEVLEKLKAIK